LVINNINLIFIFLNYTIYFHYILMLLLAEDTGILIEESVQLPLFLGAF